MADNKTQATKVSADAFLAAVPDAGRRADGQALAALMARVSGETATMWGPSIVGFGRYHYKYDSGREGDGPRIGFSPRKANLVVYLAEDFAEREALLARLGPHKSGTACLYLTRLDKIDLAVLEQLIRASLAHTNMKYPG